jgi:hypothetical protein
MVVFSSGNGVISLPSEGPRRNEASHHVVVLELVPDRICVVLEGLLKEHLKWSIGGLAGCLSLRVTIEPHPMSMLPTVHIKT